MELNNLISGGFQLEKLGETNYTDFSIHLENFINQIKPATEQEELLKTNQLVALKYFLLKGTRGMLILHTMGAGKTISASAIADELLTDREIIVLLTKSLKINFENEVIRYRQLTTKGIESQEEITEDQRKEVEQDYTFVSLNASNMYKQMQIAVGSEEPTAFGSNDPNTSGSLEPNTEEEMEQKISEIGFGNFMTNINSLEGKLLIVDEAHDLFNSITNGAKNATLLYEMIMNTKDLKLLFLTGTPMTDDPFQLVPCFNMLHGFFPENIQEETNKKTKLTLLPEIYSDFYDYFIQGGHVKNGDKFKARILGLVSYYNPQKNLEYNQEDFPTKLETKVIKVPMSSAQYGFYDIARKGERRDNQKKFGFITEKLTKPRSLMQSSYRIRSRQASNIYSIGEVTLKNMDIHCPKIKCLLDDIETNKKNRLQVVYTQFVHKAGINIIVSLLEQRGWINYNKNISANIFGGKDASLPLTKDASAFAYIVGDIDIELREQIRSTFNSKENVHGSKLNLLLVSSAGSQGIRLFNVRDMYVLEPFWNMARINQFYARSIGFNTHKDLPKDERTIQPYIYLSIYPKDTDKTTIIEPTTDEYLWAKALESEMIIGEFTNLLASASVDCVVNNVDPSVKCFKCRPVGQILYEENISTDMKIPCPCQEFTTSTIQVDEVIIDGKSYYYTIDPIKLYIFDTKFNGYMEVGLEHEHYDEIVELIKLRQRKEKIPKKIPQKQKKTQKKTKKKNT